MLGRHQLKRNRSMSIIRALSPNKQTIARMENRYLYAKSLFKCRGCNNIKTLWEFTECINEKYWILPRCKDCEISRWKKYRENNMDIINEKQRNKYNTNEEFRLNKRKDWLLWRDKNKEHREIYCKDRINNNKDRVKERQSKYYRSSRWFIKRIKNRLIYLFDDEYKEKINKRWLLWRDNNIEHRYEYCKKRANNNKDKIKIYDVNKSISRWKRICKTSDWTITPSAIKYMLIDQDYKCVECWIDITEKYTLDHCKSLYDWWAHSIDNIQLMCTSCNCRKNKKSYRVVQWEKIYL